LVRIRYPSKCFFWQGVRAWEDTAYSANSASVGGNGEISINTDYVRLIERLAVALPPVAVEGLYLPELIEDGAYRDEFGFLFLSDGSTGPFYVSLGPVLKDLWQRYPRPEAARFDPVEAARGLAGSDLASRALALGAFNALSRRLMRCAGYEPPDRGPSKEVAHDSAGSTVGMVGYFCPLIDRLVAAGRDVLVLEQQPARVPGREGVRLTTRVRDLAGCAEVLCTASVLINDTLEELLDVCSNTRLFQLIGPSGSGLPDVLLDRGVGEVGGVVFDRPDRLKEALAGRESWGSVGRKYRIRAADYPGIDALLEACARH